MYSKNSFYLILMLSVLSPLVFAQSPAVLDLGTSGIDDDGTLTGSATITVDSVFGSGAVHLPAGDGNYVKLSQPVTDLDMIAGYTYMTWFKQASAGEKGLIGLGNCCDADGGDPRNGYTMNITSGPTIRYWAGSSANDTNYNLYSPATAAINDGSWHHVAIRVEEGQVDMFFDGAIVASNSASNIPTQPSQASINALSNNVPKIGGDGISESSSAVTLIDEVRVYGCVLSDSQVVAAMNNNLAPPDRLYYTFDDDTVMAPSNGFECGTVVDGESVPVPTLSRITLLATVMLLLLTGLYWARNRA